ncbi:uncharacterized protein A1O5_01319 [Cladophialophora psammophila CBS 110553]|uniref:Peptidase A2 domain-containing protein n=1 Tax=Cladophialophora psammophila CBS 110553 TaxID=1182543 RepID=W9XIM2_9EURO|nr:uncharacterized protein A1O5_01319 [Cladophialophora psammophila CBS 110553]EXJ76811.1 hypothetical protein A1O5_01319 [Cladophialophora psammophila CBS 110553]
MARTFPALRIALMVGIGGGIPDLSKGIDIRLGDIVVSKQDFNHLAAILGHEKFPQLMSQSAGNSEINEPGDEGWAALARACEHGYERVVRLLLEKGADPNTEHPRVSEDIALMVLEKAADADTEDVLTRAAVGRKEKVVQTLLEKGANRKHDALCATIMAGQEKRARTLTDYGADVNLQGQDGTPLEGASRKGYEKVVETLLDQGADINV